MTDRFPFPVPFGWFCIGYPEEFPAGEPKAVYYFDRHLVAWRDDAGDLHVHDAFCPHLGAHLGHGGEPWCDLLVKLMLKWPGLHYSTSAFAPKHYPKAIIDYANTRGADKVLYAGYFPMGLSLERIFTELPAVGFRDEVWPKFLRENALRVLKLA